MPTVLVVEDYPPCRIAAVRLLQHEGYTVLAAASVQEALDILASAQAVDLVLLDLDLPDGGGQAILDALCSQPARADVPVIIISGSGTCRLAAEAHARLVRQRLVKGQFAGDGLLQAIQRYIAPAITA